MKCRALCARAIPTIWLLYFSAGCAPLLTTEQEVFTPESAEQTPELEPEAEPPAPPLFPTTATATIDEGLLDALHYSLDVEKVPAVEVLRTLLDDANLQLDLRMPLVSKVTLSVKAQPLKKILHAISEQTQSRMTLDGDRLRVEADTPYLKNYAVDYPNITRSFNSNLESSSAVSRLGDSKSGSASNGSALTLKAQTNMDVWSSLERSLQTILRNPESKDAVSEITVNRQAGLVSVWGRSEQHLRVKEYLAQVAARVQSQVLLEARILELSLDHQHRFGVDWSLLGGELGRVDWVQQFTGQAANLQGLSTPATVFRYSKTSSKGALTALIDVFEEYGDVRVMSSPRVIALNNQPAVLRVVENAVYF